MTVCAMSGSKPETFRVLDRGQMKEAKICVVCKRSFTWRKKWERNWSEISTCSNSCRQRKKQMKREQNSATTHDVSVL